MITPNDALQFIKDHHNGEIPYMFGKNEYARWMAEFANHTVTKHLHKLGVMQAEGSDVSEGAAVGQRSVGTGVRARNKSGDENCEDCTYPQCFCGG